VSQEKIYDAALADAELIVRFPLAPGDPELGETVVLNGAQQFTLSSVANGLRSAMERDRAILGEAFNEDEWSASPAVRMALAEEHRRHRRFLSGIDGLQARLQDIQSGVTDTNPPLYEQQVEGFRNITTFLSSADPACNASFGAYLNYAGGGGKSRLIAMVTEAFTSMDDPSDPNRVLIVVPDNAVLEELLGADGQSGFGRYAPQLDVGVINSSSKDYDKKIRLTTSAMAVRHPELLGQSDLNLVDEGHLLHGKHIGQLVRTAKRPVVAFTGSPDYSSKKQLSTILPAELINVSTRELIEAGTLSPVQMWICKTDQVVHLVEGQTDFTKEELTRISFMKRRHDIALDVALPFFQDARKGGFSCNTVDEAIDLAKQLSREIIMPDGMVKQIIVKPLFANNPEGNHEVLRKLQRGEIHGVTFVDINTGWDVPSLSFLVNLRPTASEVLAKQRTARGTRLHIDENGQIVTFQVVDLVDTIKIARRSQKAKDGTSAEGSTDLLIFNRMAQVLTPALLGEDVYYPGMVIAASGTDGKRRDFSLDRFPRRLLRSLTMTAGVRLRKIPLFGSGVVRQRAPEDRFTAADAAFGLGVSLERFRVAAAAVGKRFDEHGFVDQTTIDKAAEHLDKMNVPIS